MPKKIIDYCIVTNNDASAFEEAVKKLLAEGWSLKGGFHYDLVNVENGAYYTEGFAREMVKYFDLVAEVDKNIDKAIAKTGKSKKI